MQNNIILEERNKLIIENKKYQEIIDMLLDALEDEHMGLRAEYIKQIYERYRIKY